MSIRRGRRLVARASADIEARIHGAINQRGPTSYLDYCYLTTLRDLSGIAMFPAMMAGREEILH
jgi:hypothetical protein